VKTASINNTSRGGVKGGKTKECLPKPCLQKCFSNGNVWGGKERDRWEYETEGGGGENR